MTIPFRKRLSLGTMSLCLFALVATSGCKQQQQLMQQVEALDGKLTESQRRVTTLENEVKRLSADLAQIKTVVTKVGNVVVNMEKAEEERVRLQKEREAQHAAKAKPAGKKKPAGAHRKGH